MVLNSLGPVIQQNFTNESDTELVIDKTQVTVREVRRAINHLRNGKAAEY